MDERDRELDEMLSGIDALIKGEKVVPPLYTDDGVVVEDEFMTGYRLGTKRNFLNKFIRGFSKRQVSTKTDSSELAPILKREFTANQKKQAEEHRSKNAHGIAAEYEKYTLYDLADESLRQISKLEREIGNYYHESQSYRNAAIDIRKLEIIRYAALEALDEV